MNINQCIEILNANNQYFQITVDNRDQYIIKYSTNNQLINEIVDCVMRDILIDDMETQPEETFNKYINIYSKFYKLSESVDSFDYTPKNDSMFFMSLNYIHFLMNKLSEILRHLSKKNDDIILINRCIGCGIDLGESNPRQYCCKTYCPFVLD
jgi:hypothetical protein